jgi:hypothetical protein
MRKPSTFEEDTVMILKRTPLILLATLAISSTAYGQVQDAANNFKVPTFETKSLDVSGQNLFYIDDAENLDVNLGSAFEMSSQSPEKSWSVTNGLSIDLHKEKDLDGMAQNIGNTLAGSYSQYFMGDRGVGVNVSVAVDLGMVNSGEKDAETKTDLNIWASVGASYGRRFDARVIAQAAAICSVAKKDCSADDLAKIGDAIGKNSTGAYLAEHKDAGAAATAFFADVTAVSGGDAFAAASVLSSPIYNVGSREVGYTAGADLRISSGDHMFDEKTDTGPDGKQSMYAHIGAGYAMLLDDNSGISADLGVDYGLKQEGPSLDGHPGDGNISIDFTLGYNLDHNISWNTNAQVVVNYEKYKDDAPEAEMNWRIHAETNYAMGTKALVGAAFNVCGGKGVTGTEACATGEDKLHWNVLANFRYFIF